MRLSSEPARTHQPEPAPQQRLRDGGPGAPWRRAVAELAEEVRGWRFRAGALLRASRPGPAADPLAWLEGNPGEPRCYWRSREGGLTLAGLGAAVRLEAGSAAEQPQLLQRLHALADGRDELAFFGGFAFDDARADGRWRGFPAALALLPSIELRREPEGCRLSAHLLAETAEAFERRRERLLAALEGLAPPAETAAPPAPGAIRVVARRDDLDHGRCRERIEAILKRIAAGELHKAVLAREVELRFDAPLPAFATLRRWQQASRGSFCFAIEQGGQVFMGCSPERLFHREGGSVHTESLAGTVRRGATAAEDARLERSLHSDPKLVREHAWVTRFIRDELEPWASASDAGAEAGTLKLDRIQHRHLPIRATLKAGVGDGELLAALHPTPAVCGFPRRRARELITRYEAFERGWYSGVVGVVTPRSSELAVAIRSALVAGDRAWCYSGVGIVEGSDPDAEWRELEAKIEAFLTAVQG
mgnify:CR=1 FL=1